jgi:hypothetical protein
MQWNEVDYETQLKALGRIAILVAREEDKDIRLAIVAALNELDLWSNNPNIPDIDPPPITEFNCNAAQNCPNLIVQAEDIQCDFD